VAEELRREGGDVAIVCAGRSGRLSLEDAACGGALVRRLVEGSPRDARPQLNDAAEMAMSYDRAHGAEPESILRRSDHGRYLIELGFEDDLPICAAVDSVPIVPLLREGRIVNAAPAPRV
jgi:2-phosphosulfolactate phosphatase